MSNQPVLPEPGAPPEVSATRAVAVTGALAGVGAVAGAVTAAIGGTILLVAEGQFGVLALLPPTIVGGMFGFLLGPVLTWTFFRSIPIGRAVLGVSAAALTGFVASLAVVGTATATLLAGAVGGAILGAAGMWLAERMARR